MAPEANTNTPELEVTLSRIRTRFLADGTVEQRVTRGDNTRAWVPVNDRYQSRVSYGFSPDGALNAAEVAR